jgi:benzoylformate decarboxylase
VRRHRRRALDLLGIQFEAIAHGFGCTAERVKEAEGLADALTRSFASEGPVLPDVLVDPTIAALN